MRTLLEKAHKETGKAWPEDDRILHLARRTNRCNVLGPSTRAVLWTQGCPFRCPGCVAPENQSFRGGQVVDVEELAEEISRLSDIEGVTFSGGEPFAQAAALANLVDLVRCQRDLSFMSYSGYTLEHLRRCGTLAQKALLDRLDILVDGPYIASRHTNLIWRGSDNQIVHLLTPRYRHLEQKLQDRGNWLEFRYSAKRGLCWMGIPPKGFREAFEHTMQEHGVTLTISK